MPLPICFGEWGQDGELVATPCVCMSGDGKPPRRKWSHSGLLQPPLPRTDLTVDFDAKTLKGVVKVRVMQEIWARRG